MQSSYDVVIVGGGAAGCVLAARLSERAGRSVLLIEAGRDFADPAERPDELLAPRSVADPDFSWAYETHSNPAQSDPYLLIQGRVIGGSSAINGVELARGVPEDYDSWGCELWRWPHVLEAFRRIETDYDFHDDLHGQGGPIPVRRHPPGQWNGLDAAFLDAALAYGFADLPDLNRPDGEGIGPRPRNLDASWRRVDSARAYLDPARGRPNLTVWGEAVAHRVVWAGRRAVGVELEREGGVATVQAGEVILSAGAIGSPRLLFASGVGAADDLRALGIPVVSDLPGVGKNLQDHPVVTYAVDPPAGGQVTGEEESMSYVPLTIAYTTAESEFERNMMVNLLSVSPAHLPDASMRFVVMLGKALSKGRLAFLSRDPLEPPRVEFNHFDDPADRRAARSALRMGAELMRSKPLCDEIGGFHGPSEEELVSDDELDRWILRNAGAGYAGSGTCKIGPDDDPGAVVDDRCRVRGVEGLRVVDLSVAANVPRANTFGTTVMIGERAFELIDEQL